MLHHDPARRTSQRTELKPDFMLPNIPTRKIKINNPLVYQLLSFGHSIIATENKLRQVWSMQFDKYRCKW